MSRKSLMTAAAAASMLAASPAQAAGVLTFLIDGNTFTQPFSITNNSTAGETVLAFGFDLGGTVFIFDTADGGPPGNSTFGVPFTPVGGTGVSTGLIGAPVVADGATFFEIGFNDFGVGETFQFDIDVDSADGTIITVDGNMLIGANIFADFSNGQRGSGQLVAVDGNPDAAQFVITAFTPTPAIPEPGTWAMMLLGFGFLGGAIRSAKRRQKTGVSYA